MRPYYNLFYQEQPDISHQTIQKVLILVLGEWYSNCYMKSELASKYNMWKVGSVLVSLKVYQKSKVGKSLINIQNRHMVCSELHICLELFLDQNVNNNAHSTPLLHEALDVDHKMLILGIGLYHNKISNIFVQHHNYPEHDILGLSIFFYWIISISLHYALWYSM